jgi:hypothetical protein
MKILLDENIDVRFKRNFPIQYEVFTIKDMGWNGISNGTLLNLLNENNFDAWIVVDKNIPYQQNVATLPCPVIVLNVYRNTLKHLVALLPKIIDVLNSNSINKIVLIEESLP